MGMIRNEEANAQKIPSLIIRLLFQFWIILAIREQLNEDGTSQKALY
jgi:hypothetical protein